MGLTVVEINCWGCGSKVDVEIDPPVPAVLYGPPEKCSPAEGGSFEPGCCPHCHATFDPDAAWEAYDNYLADMADQAAERKVDLARDRW